MEKAASVRVQSLAESGIQTVPLQYVRPLEPSHAGDSQVPVIDLQGLSIDHLKEKTISEISCAAENWGFFQIVNHGIPDSLISRVQAVGKAFFDLPLHEKELYRNNEDAGNPVGYGSKVGYTADAKLDWGDYYYNVVWPPSKRDMTKWPKRPSDFTEVMDEYGKEICNLWKRLMQVLSRGLGLEDENVLNERMGGEGNDIHIRMNYYPPCPQPELVLGLSPHSDPNALTILLHDQTPGLQIYKDGAWLHVQSVPGALVVNIADQLEILSNGKYKSVLHRSLVHKDRSRMSWAMFCTPPPQVIISPLKELIDDANPPLYGTSSFEDYQKKFFTKRLAGKGHVHQLKLSSASH
uniref:Fe2OG dioxygenase domain-containing protein n=1 Tax=Araucaria cunninghamii TaxID=56994 RepID=A0A0D6QUU1_ARACU